MIAVCSRAALDVDPLATPRRIALWWCSAARSVLTRVLTLAARLALSLASGECEPFLPPWAVAVITRWALRSHASDPLQDVSGPRAAHPTSARCLRRSRRGSRKGGVRRGAVVCNRSGHDQCAGSRTDEVNGQAVQGTALRR